MMAAFSKSLPWVLVVILTITAGGVGLATVQKIARLYGGDARIEETPGGGATFLVRMEGV